MSNTEISTKKAEVKFNFKTVKLNSDNLQKLQALQADGKLAEDALEEVKDGETLVGYKRKSLVVEFDVPVMADLLADSGLSANQINKIQWLVEKDVEAGNKDKVDAGETDYLSGLDVLELPPVQRKASTKVTAEAIAASIAVFSEYLQANTGINANGLEVISKLATRKFTVSACRGLPVAALERFQGLIAAWFESIESDNAALEQHGPVIGIWAAEIEKTLNPTSEIDLDMLGLEG